MRCTPLTVNQHLICVAIGVSALIFGYFAKYIPLKYFSALKLSEEPVQMSIEERMQAYSRSFRKSRSLSKSYTQIVNRSIKERSKSSRGVSQRTFTVQNKAVM